MIVRTVGRVVGAACILCAIIAGFSGAWLPAICLCAVAAMPLLGTRNYLSAAEYEARDGEDGAQ